VGGGDPPTHLFGGDPGPKRSRLGQQRLSLAQLIAATAELLAGGGQLVAKALELGAQASGLVRHSFARDLAGGQLCAQAIGLVLAPFVFVRQLITRRCGVLEFALETGHLGREVQGLGLDVGPPGALLADDGRQAVQLTPELEVNGLAAVLGRSNGLELGARVCELATEHRLAGGPLQKLGTEHPERIVGIPSPRTGRPARRPGISVQRQLRHPRLRRGLVLA